MAYRTYVNGVQIFGNNECHDEWIRFVKSHGAYVDEEQGYNFWTTDIMGMIETAEKIVRRLEAEREDMRKAGLKVPLLYDFSEDIKKAAELNRTYGNEYGNTLFDCLYGIVHRGYAFLPYSVMSACAGMLEPLEPYSHDGRLYAWKVKCGHTIHMTAG